MQTDLDGYIKKKNFHVVAQKEICTNDFSIFKMLASVTVTLFASNDNLTHQKTAELFPILKIARGIYFSF